MNKNNKIAALLAVTVAVAGYPVPASAAKTTDSDTVWYADVEHKEFGGLDASQVEANGYIISPIKSSVADAEASDDKMLRAAAVPSAYMSDIATVMSTFPGTKNQGNYDTCWAFSAVGLAEFDMIVDDKLADALVDYSELQVSYFTYHDVEDPLGGTYGDNFELDGSANYLKVGGNLEFAARSLMQWKGITEESVLPYSEASSTRKLDASYAFENNAVHLQNVRILNINKNPDKVKQAIMEHGAVGIGYYSAETPSEISTYETTGSYNGMMVPTVYCGNAAGRKSNHAVNIVGWDDSFPASSFKQTPPGTGAWLVRNSWSDTTGYQEDGSSYFWLSYYDETIEDDAWVYDFEPADNYDYNYQYDGGGASYDAYDFDTVANVFEVKGEANEQLEAVSVSLTYHANVPYTIKVYTNLSSGSKPRSGYLAAKVSGKTDAPGIYTIPLDKPVPLAKGTKYAVVVELDKKKAAVDIEYSYKSLRWGYEIDAYIDPGQSFALENGTWNDMESLSTRYRTGNFCIKAYTSGVDGKKLAQVKNLKKKSAARTSLKLKWSKVSGADGYEIYRATSQKGTYKKVATIKSGDKTSYKDSGLSKNKTYYYRVRAYKKNGDATTVGKMSSVIAIKTAK